MNWIACNRKLAHALVVLALLLALPFAIPAAAQEEQAPERPETPEIEAPELELPDIQIETTRETVWYTDPVWILIGIGVVGLIIILVVLASRGSGGGGTTVIRD